MASAEEEEVAKTSPRGVRVWSGSSGRSGEREEKEEGEVESEGGAQKHSMWGFLQSPEPFEWVPHEYSGITAVA